MRSLLMLLAMCIAINLSHAQNTFPSNGNVGIGTTSPIGFLDIYNAGNAATTPLFSIRSNFHDAGTYGMIRFGDFTQTSDYQKGAIIYESVAGSAKGKFHIALENTDGNGSVGLSDARLTVSSGGNVGIGTSNRQGSLSVKGNSVWGQLKILPAVDNGESGLSFSQSTTEGDFSKSWFVGAGGWGTGQNFVIGTSLYSGPSMTFQPSGNVGIGTNDTQGYKLAVNGNIRAKEIKVETNWSDYVFDKTYKLRSLKEVEKYVADNHHLPDVPSAAEVKQNGLNIGESNATLLRKIEELTLYLIEKDKEKKEQDIKLKTQQMQMSALEKKIDALTKLITNK